MEGAVNMMDRPIKTINGESGELFATIAGRRYLLARCHPIIKIFENLTDVMVLGSIKCHAKTNHAAIVICVDGEVAKSINVSQWESASKFELIGSFERWDSAFESVHLDSIAPIPQDLSGEIWEFEILDQKDIIKKLLVF